MGEFELIKRFFTRPTPRAVLGVGDDCALLQSAPAMQLAISSDMLVEGRHFFADVDPGKLGHKALAVNLSDLAACGARPLAFTLALALPRADAAWLEGFANGLLALADAHGCELIGGDTTKGPLNICITVLGEVPPGAALLRSGARAGDDIWVSGTLGDAYLALRCLQGQLPLPAPVRALALERMQRPTPRVGLGLALRGIASAAADISDGLLGDLGHILERSQLGATLDSQAALPLLASRALYGDDAAAFARDIGPALALRCVLSGGDDYELVFTAAPAQRAAVLAAARSAETDVSRIGQIDAQPGLRVLDADGAPLTERFSAFDHFNSD
ncbi:MAG: thiamine-phosphate kinase [Rhodoferax sp.]